MDEGGDLTEQLRTSFAAFPKGHTPEKCLPQAFCLLPKRACMGSTTNCSIARVTWCRAPAQPGSFATATAPDPVLLLLLVSPFCWFVLDSVLLPQRVALDFSTRICRVCVFLFSLVPCNQKRLREFHALRGNYSAQFKLISLEYKH